MLDLVDRAITEHLRKLFVAQHKSIPVLCVSAADDMSQAISQAGGKDDRIQLPFALLNRGDTIDITDDNVTKVVHNYTGFTFDIPGQGTGKVSYYRSTLHYSVTIVGETRKIVEDLATALYGKLRNYCQVKITIILPSGKDEKGKVEELGVIMDTDVVMGATIQQVNTQALDAAQFYRCRFTFDLKNVNIYNLVFNKAYKYRVVVSASLQDSDHVQQEVVFEYTPPTLSTP